MQTTQYKSHCKIFLHPATCSRPATIDAFQRRTGLHVITTHNGPARAVPAGGAA